ncbi:MAG: DUF4412 domain-containing protein [Desulfobacterales bacterium]|jgi:hypothetical protein
MINRKWMRILPLVCVVLIFVSPMAYGDLCWENLVVSGGASDFLPKNLPKQVREQMLKELEPTTETERCFLTSYGFRTETKDHIVIIEYDTMTMYQLNPSEKIYTKVDMEAEMEGSMGQMAEEMAEDSRITPTDETKKIAGYNCRKYIVTLMDAENEHWLSKEVEGYKEYKAISDKVLQKNPQWGQMNIVGFSGKHGFPVKTVNNMMGMTVTTTLQKIEKKSLSKDLFKVPAGYKLLETTMPKQ